MTAPTQSPIFTIQPPGAASGPGPVEKGVRAQLDNLREAKLLTAAHEGRAVLALRAAQDVDQSAGVGAPSGRANLLRVLNEILEALPAAEVEETSMLASVTAFISTGEIPDAQ